MPATQPAHIVVVDDQDELRSLNVLVLKEVNIGRVEGVSSVPELLRHLAASFSENDPVDLILMDIQMPGVDGIQGVNQVRQIPVCRHIPILMLTSMEQPEVLEAAFEAGAIDYVTKNSHPIELVTRVRSALSLKRESDRLRVREQELLELTRQLLNERESVQKTSYLDELTGVYNDRAFSRLVGSAWEKAYAARKQVGLMLIGVDEFTEYSLQHGIEAGDGALRRIAALLPASDSQSFSIRYDDSVFAVLLTETDGNKAQDLAEALRRQVRQLRIPHDASEIDTVITVSIGYTIQSPASRPDLGDFIAIARQALVEASKQGHDRVVSLNNLHDGGPLRPL